MYASNHKLLTVPKVVEIYVFYVCTAVTLKPLNILSLVHLRVPYVSHNK